MMNSYKLNLKVCDTKGLRITAKVYQLSETVNKITVKAPEAVIKDNPPFLKGNELVIAYDRKDHKKAVDKITTYLESVFMKELYNEDNNTSEQNRPNTGRNKKSSKSRTATKSEGKSTNTLHDSGRGQEQAESNRRGVKDSDMDKESDSSDSAKVNTEN